MTKKELIAVLQMVYEHIPSCSCIDGYRNRGLVDPSCARHGVFTEAEIDYIRIALGNIAIVDAAQEVPLQ